MKKRVVAAALASLLVFGFILAPDASADTRRPVKRAVKARMNPLVAILPASDAVVVMNGKRFFNEARTGVLTSNQKLLGEILSRINSIESKTGVDLRRFDNIVAGVNILRKENASFDFDPVVIARGAIDSSAVIEAGRNAANGKYREESVNGKAIYIFSAQDFAANLQSNSPAQTNACLNGEIAVSMIDGFTLVVGSLARVRETLEHKTGVSPELTALLTKKAPGILNFAGKIPGGLSALLPLDNDELGANLDSIKTVYGNADVVAGQALISVTGRTLQTRQAADLKGTFEGLRDLGKGLLGSSRAADKQLYARLLGNVRITSVSNEISLDLTIAQGDLDALVAVFKK